MRQNVEHEKTGFYAQKPRLKMTAKNSILWSQPTMPATLFKTELC